MQEGWKLLFVVHVLSASCAIELGVPPDASIRCGSDAECPEDFTCVDGACKSLHENDPPRLRVEPVSRSLGAVVLSVIVADAEGDAVDVTAAVRTSPDGDFQPITLAGATGLSATPEGASVELRWDDAATALASLGAPGYADGLVVRLTPHDQSGPGPAVDTAPFAHGNDAPVLFDVWLDDTVVSGNAVLRFIVFDAAADTVDVDLVEVSALGDFSDAVGVPLTSGAAGSFPGGTITDLRTGPSTLPPIEHNVTWSSTVGADYDAPAAALRLRVVDVLGAASSVVATMPFVVDNAQSPPALTVTPVTDLGGVVTTPVQLAVRIDDADGDTCTLFAGYSLTSASGPWTQALTADPLVGLSSYSAQNPSPHPFTWNIAQLDPGLYPTVWLRLSVQDNSVGEEEVVGPFSLDTRVAGLVDTSPPNYISPVGSVLGSDTVLLQWTSRLGATDYVVEVADDRNFTQGAITYPPTTATELEVTLTHERSYYWRVRADVTTAGQYSSIGGEPARFHLLGSTLYVYCPDGDPSGCSDSGRVGNQSLPFQRLTTALSRAPLLGASEIRVASRGGTAAYDGIVFVQDGVSLLGGYTPDFSSRDVVNQRARLSGGVSLAYGATAVVAENVVRPTTVSGLSVTSPLGTDTSGLRAAASSAALVVEDCDFTAAAASSTARGLELTGAGPTLRRLTVSTGAADQTTGLWAKSGAVVDVSDSIVTAGPAQSQSVGLDIADVFAVTLQAVDVSAGSAGNDSIGVAIMVTPDTPVTISDSAIAGDAAGSALSVGLSLQGGTLDLSQTSITSGAASSQSFAADVRTVQGSIVGCSFTSGSAPSPIALFVNPPASSVGALAISQSTFTVPSSSAAGAGVMIGFNVTPPPTFDRCTVDVTASGGSLAGMAVLNGDLGGAVVTRSRLSARGSDSSGSFAAALVLSGGGTYTDNVVYARGLEAYGVDASPDTPATLSPTLSRNIIGASATYIGAGLSFQEMIPTLSRDIFFAVSPSPASLSGIVETRASSQASVSEVVIAGTSSVAYRDGSLGPLNFECSGNFGTVGCGSVLTPAAVNSRIGTNATVFANGFDPESFATWIIRGLGPADRDGSGAFSAGDSGVDVATTGAP